MSRNYENSTSYTAPRDSSQQALAKVRYTYRKAREPGPTNHVSSDEDDENILGPPKLSNFGSALLSDIDVEQRSEDRVSSTEEKSRSSRPKTGKEAPVLLRNASSNTTTHSFESGAHNAHHTEEASQSTLFASMKNQPSMTTVDPIARGYQESILDFSSEKSPRSVELMQKALKKEIALRHTKRRNRRFISSRLSALGPAKRAFGEDRPVDSQEVNFNGHNGSTSVPSLEESRSFGEKNADEFTETAADSLPIDYNPTQRRSPSPEYEQIDFGDLNPYQYLKKHNLPTSELPNISRVYFERQKGENRKVAIRKNSFTREALEKRLAFKGSSDAASTGFTDVKADSFVSERQPRRKFSAYSRNSNINTLSSPIPAPKHINASQIEAQGEILFGEKHADSKAQQRQSELLRKREALSTLNINSRLNDGRQHKRPKHLGDGANGPEPFNSKSYHEHEFQSAKDVQMPYGREVSRKKHVEIQEPYKAEIVPLKPSSTYHEPSYRRRPIVDVNGVEYEKMELLGRGGTSKVYKVKSLTSSKVYALKRVSFDEFDDSSVDSFKGEIELLKKLEGQPRVVKLIDYEMDHGVLYVVMECGDHDLSQILAHRSSMPLDVEFVRYHAQEMLKCVKVVHDAGIVHSDLKPANFVFVKGILKIIDFGIANAVPDHTVNIYRETQIGTPNYMAPEALVAMNFTHGKDAEQNRWRVGKPSDIWSCGCIIYQMIYGRPPYGGFQGQNRLLAIMNSEVKIVYPEKTASGITVPRTSLDVMKSCLERQPDKRSTVDELLTSSFIKPVSVTHFFVRDLIKNAVKYGATQVEVSDQKVEDLADDVWQRLADFKL
ncbi:LAMI_0G14774g1_1 [Lachancea mirantina]|uniref:LAMI_0G14774g1_1 n=1 Tax=Lachancea mirantina TaxID=1230905 RepID=A0A1G4KC92_9SACH|nr:LAMI_0G14774g1_1 [Lachancea mirantina]